MDDEKAVQDEVVKIMAQAIAGTVRFSWDGLSEEMREHYRARARKYLSALTAAGCEVVRWRPIEDAPTDGTVVMAHAPAKHDLPSLTCPCEYHPDAGWCVDELREVTHFAILRGPQGETP